MSENYVCWNQFVSNFTSDQDICFYIRLSHQSVSDLDLIHFKGIWPFVVVLPLR